MISIWTTLPAIWLPPTPSLLLKVGSRSRPPCHLEASKLWGLQTSVWLPRNSLFSSPGHNFQHCIKWLLNTYLQLPGVWVGGWIVEDFASLGSWSLTKNKLAWATADTKSHQKHLNQRTKFNYFIQIIQNINYFIQNINSSLHNIIFYFRYTSLGHSKPICTSDL